MISQKMILAGMVTMLLAACGGGSDNAESRERAIEKEAAKHGIDADVEVDEKGDVKKVEINRGGSVVGQNVSLPDGFPEDVHVPSNGIPPSAGTPLAVSEAPDVGLRSATRQGTYTVQLRQSGIVSSTQAIDKSQIRRSRTSSAQRNAARRTPATNRRKVVPWTNRATQLRNLPSRRSEWPRPHWRQHPQKTVLGKPRSQRHNLATKRRCASLSHAAGRRNLRAKQANRCLTNVTRWNWGVQSWADRKTRIGRPTTRADSRRVMDLARASPGCCPDRAVFRLLLVGCWLCRLEMLHFGQRHVAMVQQDSPHLQNTLRVPMHRQVVSRHRQLRVDVVYLGALA